MTDQEATTTDESNSDSTVDALCAVALVVIAVVAMVYWVTNQVQP